METMKNDLWKHFIIKNEVVGILIEVDAFEYFATKSPVTRMVFW